MAEEHAKSAGVTRFELPAVEGVLAGDFEVGSMPTARQLEEMHKQAWGEGYTAGEAAGFAAGEARAAEVTAQRAAALDGMIRDLAAPLAELDRELVESVGELALLIARHLVRRELKASPGEVVGVVRESLRHLPVASRGTRLRLNPDDLDLVRDALALGNEEMDWRLEADPLVSRGGCIVETETSRIDATVETRLNAIASKMLGGERESDRDA